MKTVEQRLANMTGLEQGRIVRAIRIQRHRLTLQILDIDQQGFSSKNMDKLKAIEGRFRAQVGLHARIEGVNVASLFRMAEVFPALPRRNQ